jgi:hypothetical protein
MAQAWRNMVRRLLPYASLNRMPGAALAKIISSVALRLSSGLAGQVVWTSPLLVSEQVIAQSLQCTFTQKIGIALAGLGKFDNGLGDDSVGEMVVKPKRHASHFECDTHNLLGFGIDIEVL